MKSYRAFRIRSEEGRHRAGIEELPLQPPGPGEVLIRIRYSSVNYKDALAGTGKGRILQRFPLVGGIDCAGEITSTRDRRFRPGDEVLVTGYGLSQTHDGGYADYLRVSADWVLPLPGGLNAYQAMALGTAGFTAALALYRMETNGQQPHLGPVVVTGASGGVGSLALDLLSQRGYEAVAVTGKTDQQDYLEGLGARRVLSRQELPGGHRPLEKGVWGGAVDNVGGATLADLTRTLRPWGNIASIGLAGGPELNTTVMPFILRGISILGINSAGCLQPLRSQLWQRLAGDYRPRHLQRIVERTIGLEELPEAFARMLAGETRGRTVVDLEPGRD